MFSANLLFRLAAQYNVEGRYNLAEGIYREIIARWPDDPRGPYTLSTHLLAREQYEEGWALYESRSAIPETGIVKPKVSFPEWNGEEIHSLLIYPEQGFGDQIMFSRYVPVLVNMGVRVTLLCRPSLERVFSKLGAAVLPAVGRVEIPRHDAWSLVGSLPHLVGGLPSAPYLPSREGRGGIGICTHGNPKHVNDLNRSMPSELALMLKASGRYISLHPEDTGAEDFQDTADIINDLSLVVTVDTSVAHLAGAMGKPTWLLLPALGVDWRWGRSGDSTVWYPEMKLFRQHQPDDWDRIVSEVESRISLNGELSFIRV